MFYVGTVIFGMDPMIYLVSVIQSLVQAYAVCLFAGGTGVVDVQTHLVRPSRPAAAYVGPRLEAALMGLFSPRPGNNTSGLLNPDTLANLLRSLTNLASMNANRGPTTMRR